MIGGTGMNMISNFARNAGTRCMRSCEGMANNDSSPCFADGGGSVYTGFLRRHPGGLVVCASCVPEGVGIGEKSNNGG